MGVGPANPKILFLGENPGEEEDKLGEPFVGKAGKMFDAILGNVGINRKEVFITNTTKCFLLGNVKPDIDSIDVCTGTYLRQELKLVKPQLIICLGAIAARALLGRQTQINKARNKIWYTKGPMPEGIPFIVTYHPAATFYMQEALGFIRDDLQWALEIVEGKPQRKETKRKYKKGTSISKIKFKKWVDLDLETDGLDPFKKGKEILSIQLSNKEGYGYYFDWSPRIATETRFLLGNPNLHFNGHNFSHDLKWLLAKAAIPIHNLKINDTIQNIHMLDENLPEKNLGFCAQTYVHMRGHKDDFKDLSNSYIKAHKDKGEPIGIARERLWATAFRAIPLRTRINYGCGDADATGRLRRYAYPRLKEEGLLPLHRLMMETTKVFVEIEFNGIKLDLNYHRELKKEYKKKIRKIEKNLDRLSGYEMNHRSNPQLAQLIFNKFQCKSKRVRVGNRYTNFTTADAALELILKDKLPDRVRAYITELRTYRKEYKLYGTYIKGLYRFNRNGFVHANWNLTGTDTGRSSSNNPNKQNIPRNSIIKKLFISRFSDGEMGQVDASQGELRIMAHVAKIKNMIQHFKEGRDIHSATAADGEGIKINQVSEDVRYRYKQANFSIGFGSGPETAAAEMGTTVENAERVMANWNRIYPEWRQYCKDTEDFLKTHGYVETIFYRRRRLTLLEPYTAAGRKIVRQAINATIQGSLIDYNRLCLVKLAKRIRKEKLHKEILIVGEVHDSLEFDYRKKHRQWLYENIIDIYENPDTSKFGFKFRVPMKVDFKYGPNLKDMVEYGKL